MGIKISQLPAVTTPELTDIMPEVQPAVSGTTYQVTMSQLATLFLGQISGSGGIIATPSGDSLNLSVSNTLIDYSPTIGDGTNNFVMSLQSGKYIIINGIKFFWGTISWTGLGSAVSGSDIVISTPVASAGFIPRSPVVLGYVGGITFSGQLTSVIENSNQFFKLFDLSSGGSPSILTVASAATTGEIQFFGTYQ